MLGKRIKSENGLSIKESMATGIARVIVRVQLRIGKFLSSWEKKLELWHKKALFVLFVGLTGGYCTYVLADAIFRQDKAVRLPLVEREWHKPPVIPSQPYNPVHVDSTATIDKHNK